MCTSDAKKEKDHSQQEISILDKENVITKWTLGYLSPILKLGGRKILDVDDVGPVSIQDDAEQTHRKIKEEWENERAKAEAANAKSGKKLGKTPSLATAIIVSFGKWRFIFATILYLVGALLQFIPVLLLSDLVRYFENGMETKLLFGMNPWVEVFLLGFVPVLSSLFQTQQSVIMTHLAVFAKTACATLLYEKSLRISATGRARTSTGQVVNMMSNDTAQLQRFLQFFGFFIVGPIQIIISLYLIFQQVGNATWVGVLYMFCLVPVNGVMFASIGKMRREVLKHSDSRVKMMNEILTGIRIIKFYAWEKPFGNEVGKLRKKELIALTKLTYVSAIGFSIILMSAPVIQPILVFLTYIRIQDKPINPSTAFTTVALFNIMRFPFAFLPMGFLQYIQAKISVNRLSGYFDLPELKDNVSSEPPPNTAADSPECQEGSITMRNASFGWVNPNVETGPLTGEKRKKKKGSKKEKVDTESRSDESINTTILDDLSFTIKSGELVAIVGEVGCGKSSFLSAILGEMEPINGSKVYMPRSNNNSDFTAFCNQTPWVVNDTLKGNIVFGRPFDEKRYKQILKVCALVDDLAVLPAGDMTEIGERGINLSGGQKARVCLARSMYSTDTKVLLLDDPLSAVDSHVGEHLFDQAIAGELAKGTTRLLVTHHVHFLPRCDYVIFMENGKIKHQGRYGDLIAQGVEFKGAIEAGEEEIDEDVVDAGTSEGQKTSVVRRRSSVAEVDLKKEAAMKKKGENLISEEDREEGDVDTSAYFKYFKVGGYFNAFLTFLGQAMNRGLEIGGAFWLAYWTTQTAAAINSGEPLSNGETTQYVGVYAAFGVSSVFALAFRGYALAQHRLRASKRLHDNLVDSILHTPISFFDVTPTGRVLNRFAYDTDKVDLELNNSLSQALSTIFSVLGAVGAIIASTKGIFLIPLIPLSYLYYYIQKWFRRTSTELQRVVSITGSPIFADFSQTLSGTPTVRAFGMQNRFFNKCKSSFNTNNAAYMLVQLSGHWLSLRLDILGGIISAFIGGLSVGTAQYNFIPAAWLGLGLSFAIEITGFMKHGIRMIATVEADLTSVERMLSYSTGIEQEGPDVIEDKDPKEGTWPSRGVINVNNVSMRYRDGPLVLKNLTFDIKGGEKIGVVGRTGSGKSSFMIALFRITELEKNGGSISIDGIDTSELGTVALRSNLSIIPQDPVVFSNTVRYNLDPFNNISDEEIWTALKKVRLDEFIASLPNGLLEEVTEGGENFSQGQKQLLCIARSVLRNPKVLVMDEATASIDNNTDALIQEMIRDNFKSSTILTIAHRLNTIMDSDRVLVLDDGRVAEFDTPKNLLANSDSIFYGMVEKSRESKGSSPSLVDLA